MEGGRCFYYTRPKETTPIRSKSSHHTIPKLTAQPDNQPSHSIQRSETRQGAGMVKSGAAVTHPHLNHLTDISK
jgi:hypothetical protein